MFLRAKAGCALVISFFSLLQIPPITTQSSPPPSIPKPALWVLYLGIPPAGLDVKYQRAGHGVWAYITWYIIGRRLASAVSTILSGIKPSDACGCTSLGLVKIFGALGSAPTLKSWWMSSPSVQSLSSSACLHSPREFLSPRAPGFEACITHFLCLL